MPPAGGGDRPSARGRCSYAEADKYLLAQIYNTMGDAYARAGDDAHGDPPICNRAWR